MYLSIFINYFSMPPPLSLKGYENLSIYQSSTYLYIYLNWTSIYLSNYPFIYLSYNTIIYLSICPPPSSPIGIWQWMNGRIIIYLSICLSIYLSMYLSIYLSKYISIYLILIQKLDKGLEIKIFSVNIWYYDIFI